MSLDVDTVMYYDTWQAGGGIPSQDSGFLKGYFAHYLMKAVNGTYFQDPVYIWSYEGDGDAVNDQTIDNHTLLHGDTVYLGLYLGDDIANMPKHGVMHLTVYDQNDPIQGALTNDYRITWHMPYENWQRCGLSYTTYKEVSVTPSNPDRPYITSTASQVCTWNQPSAYWNIAGIAIDFAKIPCPPEAKALLLIAGIVLDEVTPKPGSGIPDFNAIWDDTNHYSTWVPADDPVKMADRSRWKLFPRLRLDYATQAWTGDKYDIHGYAGPACATTEKFLIEHWYGYFVWAGDTVPDPPSNGG